MWTASSRALDDAVAPNTHEGSTGYRRATHLDASRQARRLDTCVGWQTAPSGSRSISETTASSSRTTSRSGAHAGAPVPVVPVHREAGQVPVHDRARAPPGGLDRRARHPGDRRADAVGADHAYAPSVNTRTPRS